MEKIKNLWTKFITWILVKYINKQIIDNMTKNNGIYVPEPIIPPNVNEVIIPLFEDPNEKFSKMFCKDHYFVMSPLMRQQVCFGVNLD